MPRPGYCGACRAFGDNFRKIAMATGAARRDLRAHVWNARRSSRRAGGRGCHHRERYALPRPRDPDDDRDDLEDEDEDEDGRQDEPAVIRTR